jgi:hypothetical protein
MFSVTGFRRVLISMCAIAGFFSCCISLANACLPDAYAGLQYHCVPQSQIDRLFSVVFEDAKPRQIAVLAGVSRYPNLPSSLQLLPASNDIAMLSDVLVRRLMFDEVIILKNENFNLDNLHYVFENYLPDLLKANPGSSVLFAFSGHGSDLDDYGFLYFSNTKTIDASSYSDLDRAINLTSLKTMMAPTIRNAQHFLALINACNGGYFLSVGTQFGANSLQEKGAHAITAGGARDAVHAYPNVGTGQGSVFFEMVVAALNGQEVTVGGRKFDNPAKDSGILTTTSLADFLSSTIALIENYKLTPRMGPLSSQGRGNQGEFFFVTNFALAKLELSRRFPKSAERVFGESHEAKRLPGLYARLHLPKGTELRTEMFETVKAEEHSDTQTASVPHDFSSDVRGACLELEINGGEQLTWRHLRITCK